MSRIGNQPVPLPKGVKATLGDGSLEIAGPLGKPPEEIRRKNSFLSMCKTPELAATVTIQPVERLGVDAAILFSDILVIPEALGQGYRFREEGGIAMEYRLDSRAKIDALASADAVPEKLDYVRAALALLHRELNGKKALLGFGGSPWTLATYMVEGGSSEDFDRIKVLFYTDRAAFDALLEKQAKLQEKIDHQSSQAPLFGGAQRWRAEPGLRHRSSVSSTTSSHTPGDPMTR